MPPFRFVQLHRHGQKWKWIGSIHRIRSNCLDALPNPHYILKLTHKVERERKKITLHEYLNIEGLRSKDLDCGLHVGVISRSRPQDKTGKD